MSEFVLNRCDRAIRVMSRGIAAVQLIVLPKVASIDFGAFDFQHQIIRDIGDEFDVTFARPEHLIQSIVWLHCPHVTMIAEIGRQTFAHQCAALLDIIAQPGDSFLLQHHRIGQVDHLVFTDIVERDKIRLDVGIEKSLIGSANRLVIEICVALLYIVEDLRFRDEYQSDVTLDGV